MQYQNIEQVQEAHVNKQMTFEPTLQIGDSTYILHGSTSSLHETLQTQTNCAVVYLAEDNASDNIAFVWTCLEHQLLPSGVVTLPSDQIISEENKIGKEITVEIVNIPTANTLRATVDTAATYNSLHADKWEVKGEQVHFVCRHLSDNVIRMPLQTQQAVKSPGDDVEYRPVVSLDIKINGELIREQLFNLSDRAQMDNPVLVGLNTLEDGNFVIDPKMEDINFEVDWPLVEQYIADVQFPTDYVNSTPISSLQDNEQKAQAVYNILKEADITFEDLIKVVRFDAQRVMENVSY